MKQTQVDRGVLESLKKEGSAISKPGVFEIINTTRSIKRLRPDPVPLELIRRVLDAGTKAPSGVNTQPWQFVVVQDDETKKFIQERYLHFANQRFLALVESLSAQSRSSMVRSPCIPTLRRPSGETISTPCFESRSVTLFR